jgi:hypothetical protein
MKSSNLIPSQSARVSFLAEKLLYLFSSRLTRDLLAGDMSEKIGHGKLPALIGSGIISLEKRLM